MSLKFDSKGRPYLPAAKYPAGYCVHKFRFSDSGLLKKLELFAYFPTDMIDLVAERTERLLLAKHGTYPPYLLLRGKYKNLHDVIVLWNKAPRKVKCYTQGGDYLKLETTAAKNKNMGKKFLEPMATLNSLGALIKMLTSNATPISDRTHDADFLFIPEFLSECKKEFKRKRRHGQLRLMSKQKLRKDLKFGLSQVFTL